MIWEEDVGHVLFVESFLLSGVAVQENGERLRAAEIDLGDELSPN
jgi:hypothetical protein